MPITLCCTSFTKVLYIIEILQNCLYNPTLYLFKGYVVNTMQKYQKFKKLFFTFASLQIHLMIRNISNEKIYQKTPKNFYKISELTWILF